MTRGTLVLLKPHLTEFLGFKKKFFLCFSLWLTGSHSPVSLHLRPTLMHLSKVTSPTRRLHLLIAIAVRSHFRCPGNGNDRSSHVLFPSKIWSHQSLATKRADLAGILSFKCSCGRGDKTAFNVTESHQLEKTMVKLGTPPCNKPTCTESQPPGPS